VKKAMVSRAAVSAANPSRIQTIRDASIGTDWEFRTATLVEDSLDRKISDHAALLVEFQPPDLL